MQSIYAKAMSWYKSVTDVLGGPFGIEHNDPRIPEVATEGSNLGGAKRSRVLAVIGWGRAL